VGFATNEIVAKVPMMSSYEVQASELVRKARITRSGHEPVVVPRDGTRLAASRHSEQKLRALFAEE